MGFLDTILGRTKPVKPNLDQLFGLPSAAVTLEVGSSYRPTGVGSVAVKTAEGGAFSGVRAEVEKLLELDGGKFEESRDSFGYTWLLRRTAPDDLEGLVTDLHAANSSLEEAGFGPLLLCTVVWFTGESHPLALVYLYKRGSWYPFVPTGATTRDNAAELNVRAVLGNDLRLEDDLSRWFPVWDAPGRP